MLWFFGSNKKAAMKAAVDSYGTYGLYRLGTNTPLR